jgi:recombination protein RecR
MSSTPPGFLKAVEELSKLPGVGYKTAQRLAFHLLKAGAGPTGALAKALAELHQSTRTCAQCFNLSQDELCRVCSDQGRDAGQICVVEEPQDMMAIERTGEFRGLYHLLLGSLSPLNGVGPENLKIRELIERVEKTGPREVILATNADVEGEATAMYLARLLKPLGIRVTRIASGLPVGGDLEYADELTLGRALEGRRDVTA